MALLGNGSMLSSVVEKHYVLLLLVKTRHCHAHSKNVKIFAFLRRVEHLLAIL